MPRSVPQRGQRGFVLAITLWILAAIAVMVGMMTLWALEQVRDAAADRGRVEAYLEMRSTRDTLLYLMATRDLTVAGLPLATLSAEERALRALDDFGGADRSPRGGELLLDGQPYRGLGGVTFAIQDEAGLFPILVPTAPVLDRFLVKQGVRHEDVPRLRDTLMDFLDHDDLRRLNGAEARDYERADQPRPPNRQLLLPVELKDVLDWAELVPPASMDGLPERLTTFYAGAVNLNTAPLELLPTWVDGCPDVCRAVVERRRREPFRTAFEVIGEVGARLEGDPSLEYRFLPSNAFRLTLWGDSGSGWRLHVRLTPLANRQSPWSVLAAYPVSRSTLNAPAQSTDSALFTNLPTGL